MNIKVLRKNYLKKGEYNKKSYFVRLAISLIIALVVLFLFSDFNIKEKLTGRAILSPILPLDCSDASINSLWDSLFKESSSGVNTLAIDGQECPTIFAYKIKDNREVYLLYSDSRNYVDRGFIENYSFVYAGHINYSSNYLNLSSLNSSERQELLIYSFYSLFSGEGESIIERDLQDNVDAKSSLGVFFKFNETDINSLVSAENTEVFFFSNFTIEQNSSRNIGLYSTKEKDIDIYSYSYASYLEDPNYTCIPNWTSRQYSLFYDDGIETYYYDKNYCYNDTGRPQNTIRYYDYDSDNNGVIGNLQNSINSNFDYETYIDSLLLDYYGFFLQNTTKRIEFKEDNLVRVGFNYNFSSPINARSIELLVQEADEDFGYIIVNGINVSKILTIDKKNINSSSVCIKDSYIEDIEEISDSCNLSDEFIIPCPGNNSIYSCSSTNATFSVTGLLHSAVMEFNGNLINRTVACLQNWSCVSWGLCTNNVRTRICTDSNNCGNISGKPIETEACISCISNWSNCSEWAPKRCKTNQTRTCFDLNSCSPLNNSRIENRNCEAKNLNGVYWAVIIFVIVVVLAIVGFIIWTYKQEKEETPDTTIQNSSSNSPVNNQVK